jgi:hypothetical protein
MTKNYVVYDMAGKIIVAGHTNVPLEQMWLPVDTFVMEGAANPLIDFVDLSGEVPILRERPLLPAFDKLEILADGQEAATLTLPEPFMAEVDGVQHAVDTAPYAVAIRSAMPAVYRVRVDHWPYKAIDVEIVAHAP